MPSGVTVVLLECRSCGQSFAKHELWILHGAVKHLSCPADNTVFKSFEEAREHALSVHRVSF